MITDDDVQTWGGRDAVDRDGHVVGEVGEVYLDDRTGTPTWVAVATASGSGAQFVPLHEAWVDDGEIAFPYTHDQISRAPRLAPGEHLDVDQERRLYDHYGVEYDDLDDADEQDLFARAGDVKPEAGQVDSVGEDKTPLDGVKRARLPGPPAPDEDDVAPVDTTCLEERLVVGTRVRVSGRTRITTRVVTEERTITVAVRREELVVEHEPATERGAEADGGADGSLGVHPLADTPRVLVLHEEVPVVIMQSRPVETVRIGVRTVTVDQQVSENVRREFLAGDDAD
ncbi:PRC and DUF2382 domain-containing protein [Allobranchiibius sp. GilTou38]|uniref:PRC and DUF2382 domain-containing protein n=1 Tax=Allobranchiibius sp. GilTou38 TaxID=2815210 RepID=UPI001AA0F72F|nr:PRC and DUF2382 domain-containing protein [Allobranchiibius sp. GilTou38]MBO1767166.1 PRC and DUF2382 domain-containing protein [Allobranchiibius sp. GilTou38]